MLYVFINLKIFVYGPLILVEKSSGGCDVYSEKGRWKCNATSSCIPFTDQCNGKCFSKLEKCADKCIPNIPAQLKQASFWSCTKNGQEQCLSQTEKCNGQCPTGFDQCGQKCLPPGQLGVSYHDCYGYCIPKSRKCIGRLSKLSNDYL